MKKINKNKISNISIPYDFANTIFRSHINDPENDRLIFSGVFGSGKTRFLKQYFNLHLEDYLPVFISPTKYTISSNSDVFKLIKYDILYHLINKANLEAEKVHLNKVSQYLLSFNTSIKSKKIISTILNGMTAIDTFDGQPSIANFIINLASIIELNKSKHEIGDYDNHKIKEYIESVAKDLNLVEDTIDNIIQEVLNIPKKTKVLIIDDLDRIDPDHIFRIFNIFNSHIDFEDGAIKFGFDKIIFVCDIDGIECIFRNRFGEKANFKGYIDKFYSKKIFHFGYGEDFLAASDDLIKRLAPSCIGLSSPAREIFSYILIYNNISIRELQRKDEEGADEAQQKKALIKNSEISSHKNMFIGFCITMTEIFNKEKVVSYLKCLDNKISRIKDNDQDEFLVDVLKVYIICNLDQATPISHSVLAVVANTSEAGKKPLMLHYHNHQIIFEVKNLAQGIITILNNELPFIGLISLIHDTYLQCVQNWTIKSY